jgi:hypothetical protein
MTTSPNGIINNRARQETMIQNFMNGLVKHEQDLPTLVIDGTTYKSTDILAILKTRLAASVAVSPAKAAWQAAVQADHDERAKTKLLLAGLRQALIVAYGGSIDTLAEFGLVPRKAAVVSPDTRVVAAAKAKATRAARHTMGKKQKEQIKGVPAPEPAPAPTPTPAPGAAGTAGTPAAPVPAPTTKST